MAESTTVTPADLAARAKSAEADSSPQKAVSAPDPEPAPSTTSAPPVEAVASESERIAELEAKLAQAMALLEQKDSPAQTKAPELPGEAPTRLIHFLEDGFTAFGTTWYRGQELDLSNESDFRQTKDLDGVSWVDMSPAEQQRRYGKIIFMAGPWPHEQWDDEEAAAAELARKRRPPRTI